MTKRITSNINVRMIKYCSSPLALLALMACFCASTAALADTTAATQMLPPTAAGSTANCGTANSILSFNPSPGVGSAINCTATTIDPSTGYFNAINSVGNIFSQNGVGGYGVYSYASYYDAPFLSVDHFGKEHQLIGTYDGWNGQFSGHTNPIFIAGYNANSSQVGYYTDIVAIGGFGEIGTSSNWDNPVATFDLTGHKVGIDTTHPLATLDVNGNINASTSVTIAGQTANATTVTTANNLAAVSCAGVSGTTAITKNSDGTFSCIAVTDIAGVGRTTVPTCSATQQLYFSGTAFSCVALPTPPSCNAGSVLTYNSGAYACTSLPTVAPVPNSCPDGDVLQYSASHSAYQCVTASSIAPAYATGMMAGYGSMASNGTWATTTMQGMLDLTGAAAVWPVIKNTYPNGVIYPSCASGWVLTALSTYSCGNEDRAAVCYIVSCIKQ